CCCAPNKECKEIKNSYDRLGDAIGTVAGEALLEAVFVTPSLTPQFIKLMELGIPDQEIVSYVRRAIHWKRLFNEQAVEFVEVAFEADEEFKNVCHAFKIATDTLAKFEK